MNRQQMTDYLLGHRDYYRSFSTCSPLAWNVKLHFDIDWTGYKGAKIAGETIHPEFDARWENIVEGKRSDYLFDELCEEMARNTQVETVNYNGKPYCEYSSRPSQGADQGDWGFAFAGRSGGWLLLVKWQHNDFSEMSKNDFSEWLDELTGSDLRFFCEAVEAMDDEFSHKNLKESADLAAWELRSQREEKWLDEQCHENEKLAAPYVTSEVMG